ncbi:hypothetical protein D5086_015991 [Populus alba]|uniref:Uncharacterized protein n=1 Tax=Populus alba TaxID=43335 RepID=A0ACC4BT21_POPAL
MQKGRGEELESGRGRSLGFGIFRQCICFTWSGIVYSIAPSGLGFTSTHVLLENGSGYMCKSNRGVSSAVFSIKLYSIRNIYGSKEILCIKSNPLISSMATKAKLKSKAFRTPL